MAGTIIGKIDCRTSLVANADYRQQEAFKMVYDFFQQMVAAGYATRIALQYGDTNDPITGAGSGTDYWDGANPFGENAFVLYRMNGLTSGNSQSARNGSTLPDFDYYVLIQWADGDAFGTSPGNPGLIDAATSDGVAIAVAVRDDGGDPWNGTSNDDGSDTKGATVWTAGASTLHVYPISNTYTGGSHTTNKQNMRRIEDFSAAADARVSLIGNADSFMTLSDDGDDFGYALMYVGVYTPRPGLTPSIPLVCLHQIDSTPWADGTGTTWGSTAGNSTYEGGVLGTLLTDLMGPLSVGQGVTGVSELTSQPNSQFDPPIYDSFPVRILQRGVGRVGYVGDLDTDLIKVSYGMAVPSVSEDGAFLHVGSSTRAELKYVLAWSGGHMPGSNMTRDGVTF